MNKIKAYFQSYFKKNSKLKIAGDIFFYLFILLMLIPVTRKEISTLLIKATMRKPAVKDETKLRQIGDQDYNLVMKRLDGTVLNLSDYKGEVILLNFWATWCPPCRAEMPSIQKLYDDYEDKMAIVLVSSEDPSIISNYLAENGYSIPSYVQLSSQSDAFPVSGIPATFLISKDGKVMVEKTGAANWNSEAFREQLDRLIGE
jgi:thiol-disulfide isomerase/thioredoxin